ncbi:MAG: hypothetical protein M1840_005987 [Geoglossum simile]|nr:MAG: hypothetical protein M1840_005987 [Geoglossum simile]
MWQSWTVTKQKLTDWRNASQVAYSGSLQLTYSHTEALISHEKARLKDRMSVDLNDSDSLIGIYDTLHSFFEAKKNPTLRIICHFNRIEPPPSGQSQSSQYTGSRRTTTQHQLANLPELIESEEVASNQVPALASQWACTSFQYGNKGFTCWVSRGAGTRDNPSKHYPVVGVYMRRWNDEIKEEVSTLEAPSPGLAAALSASRSKAKVKPLIEAQPAELLSISKTLEIAVLTAVMPLLANLQNLSAQASPTSILPLSAPLVPSNPIHLNGDWSEVMKEFFEWYIVKYETRNQVELQRIYSKLIDDDWNLDHICSEARDSSMILVIWAYYGLRLGVLSRMQSKISKFKRLRGSATLSDGEL